MKQFLSERNTKRLETVLGVPLKVAYTRGGWPHGVAEVFTASGGHFWVWRQDGRRVTPEEMPDIVCV